MQRRGYIVFAVVALCMTLVGRAAADARTDFLIRMLATSAQFRVRAQAALALGSQEPASTVVGALAQALRDDHPAVRAASAASLERLRDPSALNALKAVQNDSDASVRAAVRNAIAALEPAQRPVASSSSGSSGVVGSGGPALFYVGVGVPASQAGLSPVSLRGLRDHVVQQVTQIAGVRLAPESEEQRAAERVIRSEKLVGFFLDTSVTNIEARPDGSLRAQVSVVIGTYPGRDIRAMLSGAATISGGGTGEHAKVQAAQAAFTGALRRLPQAMQAGLARAQ